MQIGIKGAQSILIIRSPVSWLPEHIHPFPLPDTNDRIYRNS